MSAAVPQVTLTHEFTAKSRRERRRVAKEEIAQRRKRDVQLHRVDAGLHQSLLLSGREYGLKDIGERIVHIPQPPRTFQTFRVMHILAGEKTNDGRMLEEVIE